MASIKQLEDIIHEVNHINKSLLDDLLTLKDDKKLTNTQLNAALAAKEKIETKYDKAKKELDSYKMKSEDYHAKLTDIENELEKLKIEYDGTKEELTKQTQNLLVLTDKYEEMKLVSSELQEKERLANEIQGSLSDRNKKIDQLGKENKDLKAKVASFESDRAKIEKTRAEDQKAKQEAVQYSVGLAKRIDELEEVANESAKMMANLKEANKALKEAQALAKQLEADKILMEAQIATLQKRVDSEVEERETVNSDLSNYIKMLENEQMNREKIEEDSVALKRQMSKIEAEIRLKHTEELGEAKEAYVALKKQFDMTLEQVARMEQEHGELASLRIRMEEMNEMLLGERESNQRSIELYIEERAKCKRMEEELEQLAKNNRMANAIVAATTEGGGEECQEEAVASREEMVAWEARLEKEKESLKRWEEQLHSDYERNKERIVESQRGATTSSDVTSPPPSSSPLTTSVADSTQARKIEELQSVKSALELKIDELLKTLESERRMRSKVEDQLQHVSSSASATASPSKSTFSSLFSRRNLSISDFASTSSRTTTDASSQTSAENEDLHLTPSSSMSDEERKAKLFECYQKLLWCIDTYPPDYLHEIGK
eukprot:gene15059-17823_t